jgi:predicted ester cyclase
VLGKDTEVSEEDNKAVIRRWIEAYNNRDMQAEADVLAPGYVAGSYVAHVPGAPGPLEGLEAWRKFTAPFMEAFPDLRLTVEDIFSVGDKVAARVAFHGTHRGEFQGIAPTVKVNRVVAPRWRSLGRARSARSDAAVGRHRRAGALGAS